jgi:uncharacterized protein
MRTKISVLCALLVVVLVACDGSGDGTANGQPSATPSATPTFDVARALIDTDDGSVLIKIEIADTEAKREKGLMGRESLEEDAGMAFIFFEETTGSFWMKNTTIPLSIAFFDEEGKIVRILDMDPCVVEDCKLYSPEVPYFGALEVNQGAFEGWGVDIGDRITIAR